jgi:hypothetical protein
MNWYPDCAIRTKDMPEPGMLIAWEHAVWRVFAVETTPEDAWSAEERRVLKGYKPSAREWAAPAKLTVRPITLTTVGPAATRQDLYLTKPAGWLEWHVYPDEHYPVCAECAEPTPCRDRLGAREAEQGLRRMARYETAGMCPACSEVVTGKQKSTTITENLEVPGGPPVTFHLRGRCRYDAAEYERRWVAADPEQRRTTLSCPGEVTTHNDGTYDCTERANCRGPIAIHPSYSVCGCGSCHAHGRFSCDLAPNAVLRSQQHMIEEDA